MAAIDFNTLFTRLGKIGKIGYDLAGSQSAIPADLTTLIAQYSGTSDSDLIGSIVTNQAALIQPVVATVGSVAGLVPTGLASTTLIRMVQASQPSINTVPDALTELIRQMIANSQSVKLCTVTAPVTTIATNVGDGVCVVTTKRGDGLIQQNIVAETAKVTCVNDSYTGTATEGQEQFLLQGAPNTVPLWNYNFPTGSGASVLANAADSAQDANSTGNILTNSDFETWSNATSTGTLTGWTTTGTYGTDLQQNSTTVYSGTRSVQFLPGTGVNTALYQQFGTGTTVTPTALSSYPVNFWARALAGTISGGVLTVSLVDDAGAVINDNQAVANSFTQTLSAVTTTWTAINGVFRIPANPPATMRLQFKLTTALTGDSFLIDRSAMAPVTQSYPGGFGFTIFSGATPFINTDAFTIAATNNRGGQSYGATFQTLFQRFFNTPSIGSVGLILPYDNSPTQADSKIVS